ncbi:hypothetical protein ACFX5U_09645 [Sphingobacterium sp. SG20118]|uniref:hypothetical protein n=1 Tax=Sphingobacterium sp. SG20118 TaxID=3367156 RepID=UPI0037DFC68E
MKNFIKKYALSIVAVVTIVTFSAFKVSGTKAFMTIPVYFNGVPTNATQVADESKWTIVPNGQTCNNVPNLACMILVDHTDLTGGQLDPAKINLIAVPGAAGPGYIPQRSSGTGTPNPQIINRN